MKLRRSTAADTEILFDIWHRAVTATHEFVSASDLEAITRIVRNDYLPNVEFDVAVTDDGQVCGFMGMTGPKIDSLFVDPDMHGRGIGRLLTEDARRRWPDGLSVYVNEQNEQAAGFYERLGFRVVGRSPVDDTGRPYPLLHLEWP